MRDLEFLRDELGKISDCIREHGPISKEGIIQKTGCSSEIVDMALRTALGMKLIFQSNDSPGAQGEPLYALPIREFSSYRFNLPEDMGLVKIRAYADALQFAFDAIQLDAVPRDPVEYARGIARDYWTWAVSISPSSRVQEFTPVEGVGSTNDLDLFRETYVDAFVKYFPDALDRLQSGQIQVSSTLSEEDRPLMFYHLAEQAIAAEG